MTGRYLLDTNIVIAFFANDDTVIRRIEAATEVFLPVVVLGELLYGAAKSARAQENTRRIRLFARAVTVVPVGQLTAESYAIVKHGLRQKGRLIPENDIWIAALAREHGLTVVSRDEHFLEVDGLQVDAW